MEKKFIFVTGGVVSSLGKGLAAASIGCLLESRGFTVSLLKFDPYLNVDPGTMSPYQHGEVFVTDDGAETDLDMGHYERYTHAELTRKNNLTTGRIYETIIQKERRGDYLGKTVQVIPHVTNEIKDAIHRVSENVDITIVEIGGTVGDIESLPFLEAIRQMRADVGRDNSLFIHLTLVPYIPTAGELKTKPTQHSVKELLEIGIQADILLCRTDRYLEHEMKAKIALFCNLSEKAVITAKDVSSVYEVPLVLSAEGLDEQIVKMLRLPDTERRMQDWEALMDRVNHPIDEVSIGVVGKYVGLEDAYKSLREALIHGGLVHSLKTNIHWIEAESLEGRDGHEDPSKVLRQFDGILVPGGFGKRGIPGMVRAIQFAREQKFPFFGICLGMQCAVIEYARDVCDLKNANSTEFDASAPYPVIYKLRDLLGVDTIGGTMRLGAYPANLQPGSLASRIYEAPIIAERHRHRYEFNREYEQVLTDHGLVISGVSPDKNFVEIVELADHPWFLGCQFHPEFKSKPLAPHPLFASFVAASYEHRMANKKKRLDHSSRRSGMNPYLIPDFDVDLRRGLFLIAGPCVIESREHTFFMAKELKRITAEHGIQFIFKASFDKANRTSIKSFRGPGLTEGLKILADVRKEVGVPVLSDIHDPVQALAAGAILDILQIPAFLSRQTDLIFAAGRTGRIVNVKKGQFLAPWEMKNVVDKLREAGNERCVLTERGASFGYNNLVVDFRSFPIMQSFGVPVVFDVTHSLQLPGGQGQSSGGQPQYIPHFARAGVAAGVDGLFMEVHDNPAKALSDGPNALHLDLLPDLLRQLMAIRRA